MKRPVVIRRRPLRLLLGMFMIGAVMLVGGWLGADSPHWQRFREQTVQNPPEKAEWQADHVTTKQLEQLRVQLAALRTERDVESQTAAELQDQIRDLQGEIYRLKRELEFYRGIVSATKDVDGLSIQALRVDSTRVPDQYHLTLVLTRVAITDRLAEGSVNMVVEGMQGGSVRELTISELSGGPSLAELDYRFKQFKRFEGFVDLPSNFVPRRVRVKLLPKDDNHANIERVFEWPEITG